MAHVLTKAERRGIIPVGMAERRMLSIVNCLSTLHPLLPLVRLSVRIVPHVRIATYDFLYAALAEREGCGLVTSDERLIRNFQAGFPFVVPLST